MIGTIANASTILVGSIIGSTLRKGFDEKYKNIMMDSMGLAATALGINSVVQAMPDSKYHVLLSSVWRWAASSARPSRWTPCLTGRCPKFPRAPIWRRGFPRPSCSTARAPCPSWAPSRARCRGITTYLFTNAILDGITSIVLSSTFGIGIALAAIILFCWQGAIYLLAGLIAPFITDTLMTEISLVGGVLIFVSGLGILGIKKIKTLNLLPALLIPPVAVTILSHFGI